MLQKDNPLSSAPIKSINSLIDTGIPSFLKELKKNISTLRYISSMNKCKSL